MRREKSRGTGKDGQTTSNRKEWKREVPTGKDGREKFQQEKTDRQVLESQEAEKDGSVRGDEVSYNSQVLCDVFTVP